MAHKLPVMARTVAAIALLWALAPTAQASTLYVANNGVNPRDCSSGLACGVGAGTPPCRSITCAIASAQAGDTIVVGPGGYGDLDNDGILGEAGEEKPPAGCDCMIAVNKAVTLVSSHGAASTVIAARSVDVAKNVLLALNGGEFGQPGKGFTITNTKRNLAEGIVIDGTNVKVRGNQVLVTHVYPLALPSPGGGISALSGGPILIEGNQVLGYWNPGIRAQGTGKTVRKNQVSVNFAAGIEAEGDSVVIGNIITAASQGIWLIEGARAVGNAIYGGPNTTGVYVSTYEGTFPFTGVIERNNITGMACGVYNSGVPSLSAINNYWGAVSGPGPAPAAAVCNVSGGTTVTTPFATAPFIVKAPIKP